MRSKEHILLELFFNSAKRWRFEELRTNANIGRPQLARWLKRFEAEGLIQRVKKKGEHPYYLHNFRDPRFQNRKRLYAQQLLLDAGLLDYLAAYKPAKVIVLFGSFARADWYGDSDVDLFLYGDDGQLDLHKFQRKLGREIQLHVARNRTELYRQIRMLSEILSGTFIKGHYTDFGVKTVEADNPRRDA